MASSPQRWRNGEEYEQRREVLRWQECEVPPRNAGKSLDIQNGEEWRRRNADMVPYALFMCYGEGDSLGRYVRGGTRRIMLRDNSRGYGERQTQSEAHILRVSIVSRQRKEAASR